MEWITGERPTIDRIASPWLIRHFVEARADFLYVPTEKVFEVAAATGAVPYDIPGSEPFSRVGALCSFDAFLTHYRLTDPALQRLAIIARNADTEGAGQVRREAGVGRVRLNQFEGDGSGGPSAATTMGKTATLSMRPSALRRFRSCTECTSKRRARDSAGWMSARLAMRPGLAGHSIKCYRVTQFAEILLESRCEYGSLKPNQGFTLPLNHATAQPGISQERADGEAVRFANVKCTDRRREPANRNRTLDRHPADAIKHLLPAPRHAWADDIDCHLVISPGD
jgi:hypothetical protein